MWEVGGGWGACPGVGGAAGVTLVVHDTWERSREACEALMGWEVAREVCESQLWEV